MKGTINIVVTREEIEIVEDDLFASDMHGVKYKNPENKTELSFRTIEDILVGQNISANVTSMKVTKILTDGLECKVSYLRKTT